MSTTAAPLDPGATPHPDRPPPTVRELIAELARTEDTLRESHRHGLTDADLRVARRQAAVVRELRRRRPRPR